MLIISERTRVLQLSHHHDSTLAQGRRGEDTLQYVSVDYINVCKKLTLSFLDACIISYTARIVLPNAMTPPPPMHSVVTRFPPATVLWKPVPLVAFVKSKAILMRDIIPSSRVLRIPGKRYA